MSEFAAKPEHFSNPPMAPVPETPAQPPVNPLQKYFREPGMHIVLPSRCQFYSKEDIELSINDELAVFPMTAGDEMTLKNPDGLLNGDAVEKVILSCCPGIKNIRKLVSPDVDAILLAIRSCTYGEEMGLEIECPKCGQLNTFNVNIDNALQNMSFLEEEYEVYLDKNVKVFLKPYNYESNVKATLAAFEETKLLRGLTDDNSSDEERASVVGQTFVRLSQLNTELLVESIDKIVVPEGQVTDNNFILEFVTNISKKQINIIDEQVKNINQTGADRNHKAKCQKCEHEWEAQITYDPAHFFE